MKLYCSYCAIEQDGVPCDNGSIVCNFCGISIVEDNLVGEVEWAKGADGHCRMLGGLDNSLKIEYASLEITLGKGEDQIRMLIMRLNMSDTDGLEVEDMAKTFFKRAAYKKFTRRYKIDYVAASCLYLACRVKEKPYLLIDFSEKLAVNVYVIGAVYLQLCLALYVSDDPIVQKPVDPSLFIHRFTQALVQKLEGETDKVNRVKSINKTALSIIGSMKRDWMQTGRKPSGLCGAAIYIAALSEGIRFPKSEVINVVHVCESTLTKRLIEFENTDSGSLTITEFEQRAEDIENEQPNGCTTKSDRTEVLCQHKTEKIYAHGLCQECSNEFIELSGELEWSTADPPSFQRPDKEEVEQNALEIRNDLSTNCSHQNSTIGKQSLDILGQKENNNLVAAAENIEKPQFYDKSSSNYKESDDLTNDDPECLSDIDDKEVNCYLNNAEEVILKGLIWEKMNKEYLEEQAFKDASKAESNSATAEMTDEMREAHKLAALARKQRKEHKALNAKNAVPPRTAAEAAAGVLDNKGLRKYDRGALQKLFDEDEDEHASKKMRMDPEKMDLVEDVNANDEQEEAFDMNANYEQEEAFDIHIYDDNYQEHDVYELDPNYNNEHYVDGHDELDDYGNTCEDY